MLSAEKNGGVRRMGWPIIVLLVVGLGAVTWYVWGYFPQGTSFVKLFYYTIVSNVYISLIPHEPALIYYGKILHPIPAAIAATGGAFFSGVIDYQTLYPLLHHGRIRPLYNDRRAYRVAVSWYGKFPFSAIVVAALTPLPFYPVKFLAIASGYSRRRYLTALVIGRFPRYVLYTWLGDLLNVPNWVVIAIFGVMLLTAFVGKLSKSREKRPGRELPLEPPGNDPAERETPPIVVGVPTQPEPHIRATEDETTSER